MKELINQVIYGDVLEVLRGIPDESVDFILTDPPFMISREVRIGRSMNVKYKAKKDIDLDFGEWDRQWGSSEEYLDWCKSWLRECVRVLKPYRHLVFFFDKRKISYIWDYLEGLGMKGRSPLYWIKSNPVPRGRKVDFMKAVEMALWFTKGKVRQEFFNWRLGQQRDYVIAPIPQNPRLHPTQKPEEVIEVWMRYLSKEGDLVLDPFCGSGTVCVVAKRLGRNFIGVDKNFEYVEVARKRLNKIKQIGVLF